MFRRETLLALLAGLVAVSGFFTTHSRPTRQAVITMGGRAATPLGRTTTPAGKEARILKIKEALEDKIMIFCVPSAGLTVSDISELRDAMPASTVVMICKNKLFMRATKETDWADASADFLTRENMWFFVGEEMRETVEGYEKWLKGLGKDKSKAFNIKGGVADGSMLDKNGVKDMSKLPTKQELIAQIAGAIQNAGAQRIASTLAKVKGGPKSVAVRVKQASGAKLARALQISVADPEKNTVG